MSILRAAVRFVDEQQTIMQYTMLIYMDEKRFAALPKEEQNRVHSQCGAWHDELVKSGQSVGAAGLRPTSTATTLREKDGKVLVTDGPFAETKEVLGGFELLQCKDLDEALSIAMRFPALGAGSTVEVRPAFGISIPAAVAAEGCCGDA